MSTRNILIYSSFFAGIYLLLANAGGVPQAVTKAPGEPNNNSCATCHTPTGNFNTTISLEVLNADNVNVSSYIPGETYSLRVKVFGTNNPKAYGFQLSCQDSMTNSDLGIWTELGEKVKQQNLTVLGKPRKYLVQASAKTDGTFTTKWKAPNTNVGKIKFYYSGLAVNLTGNTNGDNNAFGNLTLQAPQISSYDIDLVDPIIIYPNPTQDIIKFQTDLIHHVTLNSLTGQNTIYVPNHDNEINIQSLPNGIYILMMYDDKGHKLSSERIVKI